MEILFEMLADSANRNRLFYLCQYLGTVYIFGWQNVSPCTVVVGNTKDVDDDAIIIC